MPTTLDQKKTLSKCRLLWTSKDLHVTTPCDHLVVTGKYGNGLGMASIIGYANEIKAIRAALAKNDSFGCSVQDQEVIRGPHGKTVVGASFGPITGFGYQILSHRLGFNAYHSVIISRSTGLILGDSDDALWKELRHERFSTPLLRGWVPYIRAQLIEKELLTECLTFNSKAMWLSAIDVHIDRIVESGIASGELKISKEYA